ncbi:reverse transcriptase domain-containing protein, partial [Tanacetum coccineum]
MPNNVKTYNGTGDPEDHVKNFQAAAQVERWAMPTWCHTFNSTLIGAARVWFDELTPKSINGYKDLKAAFLAYFMQQKKYVKDPVEIHNIKQRDGKTIEEFMERFKVETGRMKGAPEYMRISGFMHGVKNPELTKRLNEHVPKTMEEMMIATTAFIRGEAAATGKKKGHASWKALDQSKRHASEWRSNFRGQPREGRGPSRFTPLTRTPKEILIAEARKFKPSPPMVTLVEKRSNNKFCDFHNDKGHSTDECMQLKKQIEELVSLSPYNGIIGRPGIREIQAEPSTAHGMLKFPVDEGIVTIHGTILIPAECAMVITSSKEIPKEAGVAIGGKLSAKGRTELCSLLKKNLDIFAWKPSDMTGVSRLIVEHRLNIWEGYSPVRQKKRGQAPERTKAIQVEVQKLVEAGIMREVYYHEWLSDPVMVKKHDGSWRMCVDFTDLNKACPQDCYPLLKIDWKIESLYDYPFKCFLDAYKGYHQIQMAKLDEEKTAFHTSQGVGRNIEVYFDDLVIKSHTEAEMLRDIEETFHTLRKINMKLNPKKCMFGAMEGMFLGFMISPEGIKPCPDK